MIGKKMATQRLRSPLYLWILKYLSVAAISFAIYSRLLYPNANTGIEKFFFLVKKPKSEYSTRNWLDKNGSLSSISFDEVDYFESHSASHSFIPSDNFKYNSQKSNATYYTAAHNSNSF